MSTPINTNTTAAGNVAPVVTTTVPAPAAAPAAPAPAPATTTTEGPPAQLPDGSFTDAQVEFSNALMAANLDAMAMDDMIFQQQMMTIQQKAAMTSRMIMSKRPPTTPEPAKLSTGPELKSSIFDDDGGGDGGDE